MIERQASLRWPHPIKYIDDKKPLDANPDQVLIVEDEPMVRTMLQKMLQMWGYRAFVAANGKQPLKVAQQHEGDINVLLSDVTMPKWVRKNSQRGY